jgi:hypothetical protein
VLYLEDVANFRALPKPVQKYLRLPANEQKLRGRAAFKRGDCEWWQFTWPLHVGLYGQPRLVCPYRSGHLRFALDESFSWLTLTDTTVAFKRAGVPEDVRYLLGLLNTRLFTYRFRGLAKLTGPDMWEAFDNSLRDLPVRRINFEDARERRTHDNIVRLVKDIEKAMAEAHDAASATDRSLAIRLADALTTQLDAIALDLYGITDREERENVLALGAPRH